MSVYENGNQRCDAVVPVVGRFYNWKNEPERLVYLGKRGCWHQYALVSEPNEVWCEVLQESLVMLEETKS